MLFSFPWTNCREKADHAIMVTEMKLSMEFNFVFKQDFTASEMVQQEIVAPHYFCPLYPATPES
jgi:hypothetical protein